MKLIETNHDLAYAAMLSIAGGYKLDFDFQGYTSKDQPLEVKEIQAEIDWLRHCAEINRLTQRPDRLFVELEEHTDVTLKVTVTRPEYGQKVWFTTDQMNEMVTWCFKNHKNTFSDAAEKIIATAYDKYRLGVYQINTIKTIANLISVLMGSDEVRVEDAALAVSLLKN